MSEVRHHMTQVNLGYGRLLLPLSLLSACGGTTISVAPDAADVGRADRDETDAVADLSPDVGGSAQVALLNVHPYADCMPMIREDPIIVLWTVQISGATGTIARLEKATIEVKGNGSITQQFSAESPTIPLLDGAGTVDQRKSMETASRNRACEQMCTGATYRLDLVYEVDGRSVSSSDTGEFRCYY